MKITYSSRLIALLCLALLLTPTELLHARGGRGGGYR